LTHLELPWAANTKTNPRPPHVSKLTNKAIKNQDLFDTPQAII
jgi:hypothetical protein